jgi:transcriptional regulator with XRE-family HTH domain
LKPVAIRQKLEAHLSISRERLSQIENIQAHELVSIRKKHVDGINAFFTELLKEDIRIEAPEQFGLFAVN